MVDYPKAAFDFKARLNAKTKRKADLDAFFEGVRVNIVKEVDKANAELVREGAPKIDLQQASPHEHTIELVCRLASCKISQDRSAPSIGAVIAGEAGEKTITFMILLGESPIKAQRLTSTQETEEKIDPSELAASFVEELITGAP
jgi:hypothetical protein